MPRLFSIEELWKNLLVKSSVNFLRDIFGDINRVSQEIGNELGKTPESFNSQIFNLLKNLSENVVLPIAMLFVTLIIVLNLCKSLLDDRERQNPVKLYTMFTITSVIAIILTTNSFEIVNMILNLTQTVVDNALRLFDKENVNLSANISQFEEALNSMEATDIFGIWITLFITNIIIWFVGILTQIVILGRFIEIFMRISISPVPFATFFNREFSNVGYNFIRSMGAVSLQAVLIMVVIAIYKGILSSIATDIGTTEQLSIFLIKILGTNLTLIFMLFQTKRIADSILNVH